jgi:hypothetical protein
MDTVREAYGGRFDERGLRPYIYVLKQLDARQRKLESAVNAGHQGLPSLDSQDRKAFPSLTEASAAVAALRTGNTA